MAVRNPLVAVLTTLLKAMILVPLLLSIPVLVGLAVPLPREVTLVLGIVSVVIVGVLAGRSGTFAFASFPVTFLGTFIGYSVFVVIAAPPLNILYAALHATIAALAAWAAATALMARVAPEVRLENEEKRRCRMCGARVGPKASRCWSCRASLNRIT